MVDRAESTADSQMESTRPANDQAGDAPLEIRQLVLDHYQAVYRYAFRLTGSQADAEDITQQAFLLAHRKLHQIRDANKASGWLFAVLRSCYLKSIRRRRPTPAANLELNVDDIPDRLDRGEEIDRERLQQVLDELTDDAKLVLVLFYFEQLSYKEIAEQLDVAIGTVMSRLARAKSNLRARLLAKIAADAVQ